MGEIKEIREWNLGKQLGKGLCGIVVVGTKKEDEEKRSAVKMVDLSILETTFKDYGVSLPELVDNLKKEIKIMEMLRHRNIIHLYDSFTEMNHVFMCMELVEGKDLLTTIPPRGLPLHVARDFFFQLCSALAYCHGNKIIHGDMKPENVLVRSDNRIKVIDFGFSHIVDGQPLNVMGGTLLYSPPCDDDMTYGWDDWAAGVILYAMVCCSLPFTEKALTSNDDLDLNVPPNVPPEVVEILSLLLDPDTETRASVGDIILQSKWLDPEREKGIPESVSRVLTMPKEKKPPLTNRQSVRRLTSVNRKPSQEPLTRTQKKLFNPLKNLRWRKKEKEKEVGEGENRGSGSGSGSGEQRKRRKSFGGDVRVGEEGGGGGGGVVDSLHGFFARSPPKTPKTPPRKGIDSWGSLGVGLTEGKGEKNAEKVKSPRSPGRSPRSPSSFSFSVPKGEPQSSRSSLNPPVSVQRERETFVSPRKKRDPGGIFPEFPMSENLISVFGGGEKGKDDMDGKRSPSVTGWGKGEKKKSKKKGKKAELYDPELRLDDMPGSMSSPESDPSDVGSPASNSREPLPFGPSIPLIQIVVFSEYRYSQSLNELIQMRSRLPEVEAMKIVPRIIDKMLSFHRSFVEKLTTSADSVANTKLILEGFRSERFKSLYLEFFKVYPSTVRYLNRLFRKGELQILDQNNLLTILSLPLKHPMECISFLSMLYEESRDREEIEGQLVRDVMGEVKALYVKCQESLLFSYA